MNSELDQRAIDETPYLMQVETTTACNADCWMCPRDKATRSDHRNRMSEETFKSVIRQGVDLGIQTMLPFIDGEPLADPRMVDFIEWVAEEFPRLSIVLYTNAGLLTEDKARRLLRTRRIPFFNFSMQGGNKESYERNMGFKPSGEPKLKWETTVENVERLIRINRELGHPSEIRANMCVGGPSEDSVEDFKAKWGAFEDVKICLGAFSNFGGLSKDKLGESHWINMPRHICTRGTRHLYIYWNGNVGQCCFDLVETVTYGNVKEFPLIDIWNSDKMRSSRDAHYRIAVKNMPKICQACNAPKFSG